MILKKPYAFLIKYFKLLHLVLTLFMVNVFVHSTGAYSFFTSYIRGENIIVGFDYVGRHFNFLLYLSVFIIMSFSIMMLILMKRKKKPYILYIYYILLYSFVAGVMILTYNNISILENNLLDVRIIRANRDLYTASIFLQFLALSFVFVRTLGFDIKKFDFKRDLQGLEIDEKDKEEIELSVSVDHIDPKSEVIKAYHNVRYIVVENKLMYQIISLSLILLLSISFVAGRTILRDSYSMGQIVNTDMFGFRVDSARLTNRGFNNRTLTEGNQLVVLNMGVRDSTRSDRLLDSSTLILEVDGRRFRKTTQYNRYLVDLGNPYNRDPLKGEYEDYLIAFEVFDNINYSNARLIVRDVERDEGRIFNVEKYIDLDIKSIDEEIERTNLYFGQEITIPYHDEELEVEFKGAFLNEQHLTRYRYCLREEDCYIASEMLRLNIRRRHIDSLMFVEYDVDSEHKRTVERMLVNNTMFMGVTDYSSEIYQDIELFETNRRLIGPGSLLIVSESDFSHHGIEMILNIRNNNYVFRFGEDMGDEYEEA